MEKRWLVDFGSRAMGFGEYWIGKVPNQGQNSTTLCRGRVFRSVKSFSGIHFPP